MPSPCQCSNRKMLHKDKGWSPPGDSVVLPVPWP